MSLAGDHHVVVAVEAQLGRAPGARGDQRGDAGKQRGLAFLAAERAAHAAALYYHVVRLLAERVGDQVLHFAGVLGRAVHQHAVVFLRQRVGNLAFEVEMVLTAHRQAAAQTLRGLRQRRFRFAPAQRLAGQHVAVGGQRGGDIEDRGQCLVCHLRQTCRTARSVVAVGGHGKQRLAVKLHQLGGKNRIVMQHRRVVVLAWDIGGGEYPQHSRRRGDGAKVELNNAAVRDAAQSQGDMEKIAGQGKVVGVMRLPGDVQRRAVMLRRRPHPMAPSSCERRTAVSGSACSRYRRCSRFCATVRR